jgi:hypothetical protein
MNERLIGTVSRGVRAPIIRSGDDIAKIVAESVLAAAESENLPILDRDVVAVTEAVVARAQGNYATVDQVAADIRAKYPDGTVGVIFPILSRNRFSICLRGIAKGAKKIVLMLSYPADEVGNHLVDIDAVDAAGVNPYTDVLTEADWREKFGYVKHTFTGVDYIAYYKELIEDCGCECEVILANDCRAILDYGKTACRAAALPLCNTALHRLQLSFRLRFCRKALRIIALGTRLRARCALLNADNFYS